jgi:predicted ATPase with chaperone activity
VGPILTVASPDDGKLMLAARLPGILAPLEPAEAIGIRQQTQN